MQYLFHSDCLIQLIKTGDVATSQLLEHCRKKNIQGWVLAATVPILHLAAHESKSRPEPDLNLRKILSDLSILTQAADDLIQSLSPEAGEFEVSLAVRAVQQFDLDGIVTLHPEAFSESGVQAVTPQELTDLTAVKKRKVDRVPLLNIPAGFHEVLNDIEKSMNGVIRSGHFILGPQVENLQQAIANYCGSRYAVGVSSGTDALLLAMMAEEIGPGDEVITTPYTFFATAGSIARLGARPVFVDVEPATCNIDPDQIEKHITPKTRAILPVHLYGQCADMDPVLEIAQRHGLVVIEDAAQAIGAEYKFRRAGSMGDYGCFSFFPTKNLGGFGDGGIVTVPSEETHDKLVTLRVHGSKPKYHHKLVGGNFRLDALQAAVVLAKLKYLESWTEKRRENAQDYHRLFKEAGLLENLQLPEEIFPRHVYNQYIIRVPRGRDELREFLAGKNIATEVYYPIPLHLQECFKSLGYGKGDFPVSEKLAQETLALPVSQEVTRNQQEYVVEKIREFFGNTIPPSSPLPPRRVGGVPPHAK